MKSIDIYNAWAKEHVAMTLFVHSGPKNTDIQELRCVVMGDNGKTAMVAIYKGENGFMLYRASDLP